MKDFAEHYPGRPMRVRWVVTNYHAVIQAQAFNCAPGNPEMEWYPEAGFSTHVDHTYETEKEAILAAIAALDVRISDFAEQQTKLRTRLEQL